MGKKAVLAVFRASILLPAVDGDFCGETTVRVVKNRSQSLKAIDSGQEVGCSYRDSVIIKEKVNVVASASVVVGVEVRYRGRIVEGVL